MSQIWGGAWPLPAFILVMAQTTCVAIYFNGGLTFLLQRNAVGVFFAVGSEFLTKIQDDCQNKPTPLEFPPIALLLAMIIPLIEFHHLNQSTVLWMGMDLNSPRKPTWH